MDTPLRILLAEDSRDDAEMVILQLEQDGLEAQYQRVDTETAFTAALQSTPDLILSDYSMLQFNGLRALQILKESGLDIPFILISGTVGEEIAVEAIKLGADDYLMKDRPVRLSSSVRSALEQKRLRAEKKYADEALRESEERYRGIFQTAAVSISEEDFSEVQAALDELRTQGVTDYRAYLTENPDFVRRALQMVKVLDVNEASVKLYGVKDKTELLGSLGKFIEPEMFQEELIVFAEGRTYFEKETADRKADGSLIHFWMTTTFYTDAAGLHKALVCLIDISARKQAEEQIQRQVQHLRALHTIDSAISSSFDLRMTLGVLLSEVIMQLEVDAADVLLFNQSAQALELAAAQGFRSDSFRGAQLRLNDSLAGRAIFERHIIHIPQLMEDGSNLAKALLLAGESFVTYFGVPLIAKGQVKGVLEIFHRARLEADQDWLDFLEALAKQAAIAVDNAGLLQSLQRSNTELIVAYDATLEGWSRAMDLRDKETQGHTLRVTEMALQLAETMGVQELDLVNIRRGGMLHDIGKIGVPDSILLKPGALTDDEWEVMRLHPKLAYEMLSPIAYLKSALDIPYCHHERWDGTGYPRGLMGEQIPLAARIFAVVDVWDACTSNRPYRSAWSREQVLHYLEEQSSKQFDPQVVNAFLGMIADDQSPT